MSLVLSFRMFGKRLKRSPTAIMILAFTPKSMLDLKSEKRSSIFAMQTWEETHMNLQSARMADLSRMQIDGAAYAC
jgi:hypothetical protein